MRGYQEVAFRAAYLIIGDASEAEEATQEAFVKAYRALGRFRSGARFRPWLLAIVANEARNQRRAATRRAGLWKDNHQVGAREGERGRRSGILERCRTAPPRPCPALGARRRSAPARSGCGKGAGDPHRRIGSLKTGNRSGLAVYRE